MKLLVTGADGFIGKNLLLALSERRDVEVVRFTRKNDVADLPSLLQDIDFVFHLAGVNRPLDPQEFVVGNVDLTKALCRAIFDIWEKTKKIIPVLASSSVQAEKDNPYGASKRASEEALQSLVEAGASRVHLFRLPNVFGKWCKPNYNSVVATFCHNIARDLPIQINDSDARISLVYIDDVISRFIELMASEAPKVNSSLFEVVSPQYEASIGEIAEKIRAFKASRSSLITENVGVGFLRALYATYVSYLPKNSFAYGVPQYGDSRGRFVEMLKTPDAGQFSFFTAHPGITRGGHYHHSKTEKFLVIKGRARFKFRHMHTGESHELVTDGEVSEIVETVPGWTHDITNIGEEEMVVMLWANEIFDRNRPDTYANPL